MTWASCGQCTKLKIFFSGLHKMPPYLFQLWRIVAGRKKGNEAQTYIHDDAAAALAHDLSLRSSSRYEAQ